MEYLRVNLDFWNVCLTEISYEVDVYFVILPVCFGLVFPVDDSFVKRI